MAAIHKWALITGASSGIGKALAFEFAAHGFNIFLTARNAESLRKITADCARNSGIETKVHPADLSDSAAVDSLIQAVSSAGIAIEVLVNNAGFGVVGEFGQTDIETEQKMVDVQLSAMLKLTKALLPPMIARRSGRILNVASVYSFAPVPFQSVYSACKAFMLSFSESLAEELKGTGVTVTAICPGTTQTEFRKRAGVEDDAESRGVTPETVARIAVRKTLKGKRVVVPGFPNKLFAFFSRRLPLSLVPRLIRHINNARGVNK